MRKLLAQQREKLHSKGEAQQVLSKLNSRLFPLGIISITISIGIGIGSRLMFVLQGGSVISSVFEIFVLSMVGLFSLLNTDLTPFVFPQVAYFVVSIINSLAQSYKKRLEKEKRMD